MSQRLNKAVLLAFHFDVRISDRVQASLSLYIAESYQTQDKPLRKTTIYSNPSTHNPLLVEDSLELMRGIDNILVDLIIYNHNTHKSVSRSINLAEERHSTYRNQLGHPTPLSQVHGVRIPIHKALASTSHIQQS
jgi:hypothetical protein